MQNSSRISALGIMMVLVAVVVAVILLAASVLIVYLIRHHSHSYLSLPTTKNRAESIDDDLLNMIPAGESSKLEFKSTLRTNLKKFAQPAYRCRVFALH